MHAWKTTVDEHRCIGSDVCALSHFSLTVKKTMNVHSL
jgi:ferredoxin